MKTKTKFVEISHNPKSTRHSNNGMSETFVLKRVSDGVTFSLYVHHESVESQSRYTLDKWDGNEFKRVVTKNPYDIKSVSTSVYGSNPAEREKLFTLCFDDLMSISEHF